jgi:PAS domain S-box-containing protein
VDTSEVMRGGLAAPAALRLRRTIIFICCYVVVAVALIPFARHPGPEIPGITALFVAVVFVTELSTGLLLFVWFRSTPKWSLLLLGSAYLYSAFMVVAHLLTFPGAVVAGERLVSASPQSAGWIFVLWVTGFAFVTLMSVLLEARANVPQVAHPGADRAIAIASGGAILLAFIFAWTAIAMVDQLPPLVAGSSWTALNRMLIFLALTMLASSVAIILTRIRSELFLWLALALTAMAFANIVSEIGGGRYTIGWLFARLSWIFSACVLFLYFLKQFERQQRRLALTDQMLGQRTLERDRIWSVSEDLLGVSNFEGYFTSINPSWQRLLGWSEDEILSMHVSELRHPDDAATANEQRAKLARGIRTVRMENRFRHKNGSWRWIAWTLSAENGLIYVAGRHMTPEKTAAEALRKSEQQFRLLVQGVKDYAIYMIDPDGRITSWNIGAQNIKGYRAEDIIGQNFSCFYTQGDRNSDLPARALRQAEHEGKYEEEGWRVRKDGSRFWASVVIDPIRDETGKLVGFAKVTKDITEQRKAKELLEEARNRLFQAQKMEAVGQLTGGVAHDFNNLLTIMLGNLDTAQRYTRSLTGDVADQLTRVIGNARTGAQRAAALTQRLLAFSRRQPLSPKPLDVNKFVAGAVDFLQRSLGETVHVEAVGGGGLWSIEADPNELEAALLNLALNARDAMPDGGKLTIETSNAFLDEDYCRQNPEVAPGQYVLISVSDTGIGMTKDIVDRAFEPFFTTKTVGQGTGLGLSQVYGFVKQSGGHIKIYSEPGHGTAIKIYLPRLMRDAQVQEAESTQSAGESLGETILVVEDDADVRAYVVEVLRDLEYKVLEAQDAPTALAVVERLSGRVDLLLADVILPGMHGRDLARKIHARWPELKVLFMTGYSRNAIVHHGRLDPGVEVIQKPLIQADLAERIRKLLDASPRG